VLHQQVQHTWGKSRNCCVLMRHVVWHSVTGFSKMHVGKQVALLVRAVACIGVALNSASIAKSYVI
jgi:hypothetical protein